MFCSVSCHTAAAAHVHGMLHTVEQSEIITQHQYPASHSVIQATLADRRTPDAAALAVYDSAVQLQDKVTSRVRHACLR
jgi:hypothetical protein